MNHVIDKDAGHVDIEFSRDDFSFSSIAFSPLRYLNASGITWNHD